MDTKTKVTHTPGPWHVNEGIRGKTYVEHAHGMICDMQLEEYVHTNEDRLGILADANLIAAAPELLASLKWLVDACETESDAMGIYKAHIEQAKAAIAKATNSI